MAILASSSTFCQTTDVWAEKRGDSTVYLLTECKAQEIAGKLIDLKQCRDSIDILTQINQQNVLKQQNLTKEVSVLKSSVDKCDQVITLKDKQIANGVEIESTLRDQVRFERRRKWLFGIGGVLTGIVGGYVISK